VYKVFVAYKKDADGFDWPSIGYWLPRSALTRATAVPAEGFRLTLATSAADTLGTDTIEIDPDGSWRITRGAASASGTCTRETRAGYQSPAEYLRGLLPDE
jgi:hypothetical protein